MTMSLTRPSITEREVHRRARDALWRAGDLQWMLDYGRPSGPQREFYDASKASTRKTFVSEDARRLGKSVALVIIAFELALKNPGRRINWCQDTSKGVRSSAIKTMEKLCRTAPPDCRGRFNVLRSSFEFPNGAYIFIFGGNTEEDADSARGGDDPIASFFDEAGYMRFLKYIYRSIVKPGMRLVSRDGHFGMIFVSSSTPEEPDHFFIKLADIARKNGAYVCRTIYASPDADQYIAEEAADAGLTVEQFKETESFQRELMCIRVVNVAKVMFPEFHKHESTLFVEWPRPIGFEQYLYKRVAVDLGGIRDQYGLLWGYVDFVGARIVVEDEELMAKPNTEQLARVMVERESRLWADANPDRVTRIIDDDTERTIRDLWDLHKVRSSKAVKQGPGGGRSSAIGWVRAFISMGVLAIHPRCVILREQLRTAVRNTTGTDFERTEDGHFDLCAALMYFCRDAPLAVNPYPDNWSEMLGRQRPAHHPIEARRELVGSPAHQRGLAGAILAGNPFTQGQLKVRR